MEEKERYKLLEEDFAYAIVDNEAHKTYQNDCFDFSNICDLLNQQDKENQQLKQQLAEKEKEIEKLEEQLKTAIIPKFNRQEHIYCVAFGEIKEFVVVAYLDNNITLCEDTTTNKLEWCDNKFLVLTKEEAEAKLKELGEKR